ncbi:alpha/beta fold hydrolase [Streptomyces sp. NPDC052301]|uniref:alpha/beta fold hydrolase n=1 Tax=Streptomyces sp. NPDC052301 TaxID=3365687 RepID=UPI0037CD2099
MSESTSRPALLLAHGAGGSPATNCGPVMDRLAVRYTVTGADHPGTGSTPRATRPLELNGPAEQLPAVADAAGVERFTASGFALGGPVAIRPAARHPERVTGLVLTAPSPAPTRRYGSPRAWGGRSPSRGTRTRATGSCSPTP